ncbi:uncharacterized protein VSU04_005362 isoform 2-T2 [Chlamydotis macqueenii]
MPEACNPTLNRHGVHLPEQQAQPCPLAPATGQRYRGPEQSPHPAESPNPVPVMSALPDGGTEPTNTQTAKTRLETVSPLAVRRPALPGEPGAAPGRGGWHGEGGVALIKHILRGNLNDKGGTTETVKLVWKHKQTQTHIGITDFGSLYDSVISFWKTWHNVRLMWATRAFAWITESWNSPSLPRMCEKQCS